VSSQSLECLSHSRSARADAILVESADLVEVPTEKPPHERQRVTASIEGLLGLSGIGAVAKVAAPRLERLVFDVRE